MLPGPLFSVTSSFRNFIGLNFSFEWDKAKEEKFVALADMLRAG